MDDNRLYFVWIRWWERYEIRRGRITGVVRRFVDDAGVVVNDPLLFVKFAGINDEAKLIDFANRWGLLTTCGDSEPISLWQKEIETMRWALDLWEAIQTESPSLLDNFIRWTVDWAYLVTPSGEKPFPKIGINNKKLGYFKRGALLQPAKEALLAEINLRIQAARPALILRDGEASPYLIPNNLLTALWVQFYLTVIGERGIRRCVICGRWMDVTGCRRSKRMHEECSHRERQKRYEAKKREG